MTAMKTEAETQKNEELNLEMDKDKTSPSEMHDIDIIVQKIDVDPDEIGKREVVYKINLTETDYSI